MFIKKLEGKKEKKTKLEKLVKYERRKNLLIKKEKKN